MRMLRATRGRTGSRPPAAPHIDLRIRAPRRPPVAIAVTTRRTSHRGLALVDRPSPRVTVSGSSSNAMTDPSATASGTQGDGARTPMREQPLLAVRSHDADDPEETARFTVRQRVPEVHVTTMRPRGLRTAFVCRASRASTGWHVGRLRVVPPEVFDGLGDGRGAATRLPGPARRRQGRSAQRDPADLRSPNSARSPSPRPPGRAERRR